MSTVAVIGGGITGLTAAFRLSQKQVPVTLYEAADRVGGPMRTLREEGYLSEYGPNTILETSPVITSLIKELGLEQRRLDSNPAMNKNYIVRHGELRQLPPSPGRFIASSLFSLSAKMRVCCEPFIRRKSTSEDESLANFVRRRLGNEFLDNAINPFVAGVYAGDPESLSVRYGFPKLLALEDKYGSIIWGAMRGRMEKKNRAEIEKSKANKLSFDDGLQVLPDTLQARLKEGVELRAQAIGVRQMIDGWMVSLQIDGHEVERHHTALILAAPAHQIAQIKMEAQASINLSVLKQIVHPPVACVTMGFRRDEVGDPLNGFGFLVPENEKLSILGTTFSSSLFSNRAPSGHVLLTTFLGGCRQPELAHESSERLFDLTRKDLQRVLKITGKPTYQHHHLYPRAIPQYNVGHKIFVDFMNATEAALPGLYFAGSYRDGISVGNCILSGHDIADRVSCYLDTSSMSPLEHADTL